MQKTQLQGEAVLELERQLRVYRSQVHNAFSEFFHPRRMTEWELKAELGSRLRTILEEKDGESALVVATNLDLSDVTRTHPKINIDGVEKARRKIEPTFLPNPYASYAVGTINTFNETQVSYDSTDANKQAALEFVKALSEATR